MRFFTTIYLVLLAYIIAIFVFWGFSLQKQSSQVYYQQVMLLKSQVDSSQNPYAYNQQLATLKHRQSMRTSQYLGEGATFLIVIFIGAVVVYTSFARRITLSRQQNNFMLSVTHELKSPIAAMKLNMQTLERHQLDEEKKKQLIARCIKEANRLNDLCNNMLFASQLEGRRYKFTKERFDLSALLEDAVEDYAVRYPRKFEQDIDPGIRVTGDKVMLHMAINNLLENAVKYTPENKPITIALAVKDSYATLAVKDEGAGIPESEKKKIFNKFYRVGNEESRKAKGTGLGLYLTNKIVLQHKGRIAVKNNTPSGSVFEICLPV
jgi:signal transduction histidine kinase